MVNFPVFRGFKIGKLTKNGLRDIWKKKSVSLANNNTDWKCCQVRIDAMVCLLQFLVATVRCFAGSRYQYIYNLINWFKTVDKQYTNSVWNSRHFFKKNKVAYLGRLSLNFFQETEFSILKCLSFRLFIKWVTFSLISVVFVVK